MKYEGKFMGVDVYSDPECPLNKIYFIEGKIKMPPGMDITEELSALIEDMIKKFKIVTGQ